MSIVKEGRDDVILGSGHLFMLSYEGEIPSDTAIEVPENSVGRISGGAKLEYSPTEYKVVDDDNEIVRRVITEENVTFSSGVLTWDLENLAKLGSGKYHDDAVKKERVLEIGGAKSLKNYLLRFVHDKNDDTKLRMTMVATAGSGFTLTFVKDKETVIDAKFGAISQSSGLMVALRDEYKPEEP